jgi:glucose-6-phosphate 1-epimerase
VLPWLWTGSTDTRASLMLRDSEASRALWNVRFVAELSVELGANQLLIEFAVGNPDVAPLQWAGTLHTFLALDAGRTHIHGLGPGRYLDRGNNSMAVVDWKEEFRLAGHTDRAYLDAGPQVMVEDGRRRLIVSKRGFRDTVVWNPGRETSARFADLGPEDHVRFICVEAAEVRPVSVGPADRWTGSQILKVI